LLKNLIFSDFDKIKVKYLIYFQKQVSISISLELKHLYNITTFVLL